MKRTYNFITNNISYSSNSQVTTSTDLILYEDFSRILIEKQSLSEARKGILVNLVDDRVAELGFDHTQATVTQLGHLNDQYFQSHIDELNSQISEVMCREHTNIYTAGKFVSSPHKHLLDFLAQKIETMLNVDYNLLIEITNSWKAYVFFLLQPAFITALGVENYILHVKYLLTQDNLTQLFIRAKHPTTATDIFKIIPDFTSIPIKSILIVSATIIMVPVLYLCYQIAYPSPVALIKSQPASTSNTTTIPVPGVTAPSLGNEYSDALKRIGTFLHQIGGEMGALFANFTSGVVLGSTGTTQEKLKEAIKKSDTEITINKENRTISLNKTETLTEAP